MNVAVVLPVSTLSGPDLSPTQISRLSAIFFRSTRAGGESPGLLTDELSVIVSPTWTAPSSDSTVIVTG